LFSSTKIIIDGSTYSQLDLLILNAYKILTSLEFILILYFMIEIMGIRDVLCKALQQLSQDIVMIALSLFYKSIYLT